MEQTRKKFLKHLIIGVTSVPFLIAACKKSSGLDKDTDEGSSSDETCSVSPTETAGPFPTKSPSSLIRKDIRDDRSGIPLNINITIQNQTSGCTALAGVLVDFGG